MMILSESNVQRPDPWTWSEGHLDVDSIQFPLETPVLADFIRELAYESLLAFADHQHVCYCRRQGDLRSGHDSVRGRYVFGLTFQWSERDGLGVL